MCKTKFQQQTHFAVVAGGGSGGGGGGGGGGRGRYGWIYSDTIAELVLKFWPVMF